MRVFFALRLFLRPVEYMRRKPITFSAREGFGAGVPPSSELGSMLINPKCAEAWRLSISI
jgi:hypothetical protein